MADEIKSNENQKNSEVSSEKKELTLIIRLSQEGQLSVVGPGNGAIYDEPLCFYMLYKSLKFIESANQRAMNSRIIMPGEQKSHIKDIFRNIFRRK